MAKQHDERSALRPAIKPSPKRYFILFMFVLLIGIKSFQWIFFASITNVIADFYQVSNVMVNWTTVVFMITYLTLALPISCLNERIGLRNGLIIGAIGTSIGLIIKCFSCYQDGFMVAFIGHVVIGVVEPFFYSAYSQLAIVWFPDSQVSMATSIGVMGNTLGMALAFIIPVSVVGEDASDLERVQFGLFYLFLVNAVLCSVDTIFIVLFFDEQPKCAPSQARYNQIEQLRIATDLQQDSPRPLHGMKHFLKILGELLSSRDFNLMHISFGINIGTGYAIHTVLNQVIAGSDEQLHYSTSVVGRAGLILLLMGVLGSVVCGYILDKWHAYKSTAFLLYLFAIGSLAAFTVCLKYNEPILVYVTMGALGLCLTGYECCGFEYAVELTYPKPEQISATMLNVSGQIYGILVTFAASIIVDSYGSTAGCCFLCLSLALGSITSLATGSNYKRLRSSSEEPDRKT